MDRDRAEDFYYSPAFDWINNIRWKTWDDMPHGFNFLIGDYAGYRLAFGDFNLFLGRGVGSAIGDAASGQIIIALPNNRLFKADLKAETAEFMDYSDNAAMVAPEFRRVLS